MALRTRCVEQSRRRRQLCTCLVAVFAVALLGTSPVDAAPTAWNVSLVPWNVPGPSQPALASVACPSPGVCFAVGERSANSHSAPLVESRGANGWRPTVLTAPGSEGGLLAGIACPSRTECIAVGLAGESYVSSGTTPLIERYDGKRWLATTLPASKPESFSAIACASKSHCLAIGAQMTGTPQSPTFTGIADTWNGSRWTPSAAVPKNEGIAEHLACPTTTWCVAIGGSFAFQLSGGVWKASKLQGAAYGITCPRVGRCFAVGSTSNGSYAVWMLSSNKWSRQRVPGAGAGNYGALSAVSCVSVQRCTAVGTNSPGCGPCYNDTGVAMSLSAGRWTVADLPYPAEDPTMQESAIACTSATTCVAVGSGQWGLSDPGSEYPYGYVVAAVLQLSGTTWTVPPLPTVIGPGDAWFSGVSCAAGAPCVAVGDYQDQQFVVKPLVASDSTSGWSAEPLALPSGVTSATLNGVSCVPSLCVAVGSDDSHGVPLIEEMATSGWTSVTAPMPSGISFATLAGVSCTSTTSCVAVGSGNTSVGTELVVLTMQGKTWSAAIAPAPAGSANAYGLTGVACTSSTSCVAVGGYQPTPPTQWGALVETLSGGVWHPSTTPSIAGDLIPELSSVGCFDSAHCFAPGNAYVRQSSSLAAAPFADVGPSPWTTSALASPPGARVGLAGAACTSATTCLAVGDEVTTASQSSLVETGSSGAWSSDVLPAPAGTVGSSLAGISCATSSLCTAVGEGTAIYNDVPEVATYNGLGA